MVIKNFLSKIFSKFKDFIDVKNYKNNVEIIDIASELLKSHEIIAWFQSEVSGDQEH